MTDAVEIQQKVLEKRKKGKPYTVVTDFGQIEFKMKRVSRTDKQAAIKALPDALVKQMREQADEEEDTDFDISDLQDMDDLSETNPDEFDPDTIMPPETVDVFEDLIVDALHHGTLSDIEIRELVQAFPDKMFYATAFVVIAHSGESAGVKSFRTQ